MNPADPSTPPALDVRTMEQHRAAILSLAPVPNTETIPVDVNALSRILAADQQVINAIPPFDNSAMDGFLLHRADLDSTGSATLDVVGDVAAEIDTPIFALGVADEQRQVAARVFVGSGEFQVPFGGVFGE